VNAFKAAGLLAALACVGCQGPTGDVSGTVTYLGAPLPVGSITFLDAGKNPVGTAAICNGKYTLRNLPVGTVTIIIMTPPAPNLDNMPPAPPPRAPKAALSSLEVTPRPDVPDRYADPNASGLTYTVQPGAQQHNVPLG
jgi:hypothetical protein